MIGLLLALSASANPDAQALKAAWQPLKEMLHNQGGIYPIDFTDKEFEELAKGKVAKRRERLDGTDRVLGVVWAPVPRDVVWVATQDEAHWDVVAQLTQEVLPASTFHTKLLFQHIDLPWPFADRQWVIKVTNNLAVIEATNGVVWERTWDLTPERGAKAQADNAIWVDVNDGGWLAVEIEGGTLLAYHVRSRIGGAIPDDVATRYAYSTLSGMLGEITRRAVEETVEHYTAEHTRIRRPDGTNIGSFR